MPALKLDDSGPEVTALQQALKAHHFDPGLIDGEFGHGTEAAVMAFQKSGDLLPDGIAGPATAAKLGLPVPAPPADITGKVTVQAVARMFPGAPLGNIKKHLPFVMAALRDAGLGDKPMILMALGTIRAETGGFEPIGEGRSRFNTSPNGHPFDLYDNRNDLGNRGAPDGAAFRGRGFVQLTGRSNYTNYSTRLGMGSGLVDHPDQANDPAIAAKLLALFLKDKERRIRADLLDDDLRDARRAVNGGSHGLDDFTAAYRTGQQVISGA